MNEAHYHHVDPTEDDKTWAMVAHLASFSAFLGLPFGGVLGPLIVWLIKKEGAPHVDIHGKEALNFQISMLIYTIVSAVLCLVFIGFVLLIGLLVFDIIVTIIAAIKAKEGSLYEYPLCIRFVN